MAHNSPESHASNIIGTEKDNNKPMTPRRTYTWKEAFDDALGGAEDGLPPYRTFVGYCYDVGKGTKRDLKRAIYWYSKAAANGSTDAMFNLALCYGSGRGIRQNRAGAVGSRRRSHGR